MAYSRDRTCYLRNAKKRVLRFVASSPALHYFILETFGTQWSKLNIIISCPIVRI